MQQNRRDVVELEIDELRGEEESVLES